METPRRATASYRLKREELKYLRASLPSTVPDYETKQIPLNLLKDLQGERLTTQSTRHRKPLILRLRKPIIQPSLGCFLDTKANFSYRHRMSCRTPHFSEGEPMLVKVFPNGTHRITIKRRNPAIARHESVRQERGTGELRSATPKNNHVLTRLNGALNRKVQREYQQDKFSKTFAERYLETKVFQRKSPQHRLSI
jgi:hypothetical protein